MTKIYSYALYNFLPNAYPDFVSFLFYCGKILGEEECLKDVHGQLVFDVNSEDLKNPKKYPKFTELKHRIEVTQLPGEIIFVPSGWHHQVFNLVSLLLLPTTTVD